MPVCRRNSHVCGPDKDAESFVDMDDPPSFPSVQLFNLTFLGSWLDQLFPHPHHHSHPTQLDHDYYRFIIVLSTVVVHIQISVVHHCYTNAIPPIVSNLASYLKRLTHWTQGDNDGHQICIPRIQGTTELQAICPGATPSVSICSNVARAAGHCLPRSQALRAAPNILRSWSSKRPLMPVSWGVVLCTAFRG